MMMHQRLGFFLIINLLLCVCDAQGQEVELDKERLADLYQSQQYQEAAVYLKGFYQEGTANQKLLEGLAYCNRMTGNYAEAEEYYLQLLTTNENDLKTLLNLASINFQRGRNQQAADYYSKVLALDSTHIGSYKAIATIAQNNGELDTAFTYLSKANKIEPGDVDVAYDLGVLYIASKQYKMADSILKQSLAVDKENVLLLKARAQALYGMQAYEQTIQIGEQLMKMGDRSDMLLNLLGPSYYFYNQPRKCIDIFLSLEERGDLKEAQLYYIAMSYKRLAQYQQAINYLDKTLETSISPNVANYYFEKAALCEKIGHPLLAATAYTKSLQFQEIPMTYYSLGLLYDHELKKAKTAVLYYKQYMATKPTAKEDRPYVEYVMRRLAELDKLVQKKK